MDIYLMVDCSGSMCWGRLDKAKEASHTLINSLVDLDIHRLGVVSFSDTSVVECALTNSRAKLNSAIDRLYSDGGTNLASAISDVTKSLLSSKRRQCMIILTDGRPDSSTAAESQATIAKSKGIKVVSIGVSLDTEAKELLTRISSTKEDGSSYVYLIDSIDELSKVFKSISKELALV